MTHGRMFFGWVVCAAWICITAGALCSQDLRLSTRRTSERYRLVEPEPTRRILGERNGVILASALPREIRFARDRFHAAEGGGGDATSLELYQAWFLDSACAFPLDCGGPCNAVLVTWIENTPNPEGITVLLDAEELGVADGLDPGSLPDVNLAVVFGLPAGSATFGIRDSDENLEEATITILDNQPFQDPENLRCESGNATDGGGCDLIVSWDNPGPWPGAYWVTPDGGSTVTSPGFSRGAILGGLAEGNHTVEMRGVSSENPQAFYLGCIVSTSCDISCTDVPCRPPVALELCQAAYGPQEEDNLVNATWVNGVESYADGITGLVDGEPVGTLEGNSSAAGFGLIAPGEHTVGVQGSCGDPDGASTTTQATFNVLAETPHTDPVDGGIACEFLPDADPPSTVLMWTSGSESLFADVYVQIDPDLFFLGSIAGSSTRVTIEGTDGTETILLQFFTRVDGLCYGSEPVSCTASPPAKVYVQGLCNGVGDAEGKPQISSAIFGLTFLFLGGEAPPCEQACDANGDGGFDLTDMVFVLSYLFLGGNPPPLWLDPDSDGSPDPTCTEAAPEDDCVESHAFCAG